MMLPVSFSCFERRAAQLPSIGESTRNIAKLVTNGQTGTGTGTDHLSMLERSDEHAAHDLKHDQHDER